MRLPTRARSTACLLLAAAGLLAADAESPEPRSLELWLVTSASPQAEALRLAVEADLERTPRQHRLRVIDAGKLAEGWRDDAVLAVLAVDFDQRVERPRLGLARSEEALTPGWLVHAVLRAGATVDVSVDLADRRASWTGQLVERSTRRRAPDVADAALAGGAPSVRLTLPLLGEHPASPVAARLLAATARRLDGLDGAPVFEDEFLVAAGRVWLRRDLYWLGLGLWLALFWRGRGQPGQEFRWLLLAAWLVAPAFAAVLLGLPALVAAWRPRTRWPAVGALVPAATYAARWSAAIAAGALPVIAFLPTLLVASTLGLFTWRYLLRGRELAGGVGPGQGRGDRGETAPLASS